MLNATFVLPLCVLLKKEVSAPIPKKDLKTDLTVSSIGSIKTEDRQLLMQLLF
jgi:hypothetical protein